MPKLLREALSTRKALQKKPNIDLIKELSDEDVRALQGVFLEMLKDLDRVCAEHHICYMAAGGTALGAVRHGGFIPWDDDADILMPRKDLDRFVEIFDEAMGEKYGLTSPNSKYMLESNISAIYKKHTRKVSFEAYNTPYPKGIHVDIFAIETVPMNPLVRRIKGTVAMGLQFIAVSTRARPGRSTGTCGASPGPCSLSSPTRPGGTSSTASCGGRRRAACGRCPPISGTISGTSCPKASTTPRRK